MAGDDRLDTVHDEWAHRSVWLICGPPGSGKSTLARTLSPRVVELENYPTTLDHRQRLKLFGRAEYRIGTAQAPHAAIVRGAPTSSERTRHAALCKPSRTIILAVPADICHERISARARQRVAGEHEAVDDWWRQYLSDGTHQSHQPAQRKPKPPHHSGDYQVRSRQVREAAKADPLTKCWRCGLTLDQHAAHKTGKRPWWTAGHVRDGDPTSPLAPEASTCNFKAGRALQDTPWRVTTRKW